MVSHLLSIRLWPTMAMNGNLPQSHLNLYMQIITCHLPELFPCLGRGRRRSCGGDEIWELVRQDGSKGKGERGRMAGMPRGPSLPLSCGHHLHRRRRRERVLLHNDDHNLVNVSASNTYMEVLALYQDTQGKGKNRCFSC